MTGWQLSGRRRMAHYIWEDPDPEGYLVTACGVPWWASDAVPAREAREGDRRCQRCARSRRAQEKAHA